MNKCAKCGYDIKAEQITVMADYDVEYHYECAEAEKRKHGW